MIPLADMLAALGIGLAGAGHCLGMCGGIASAISLSTDQLRSTSLAYHVGRISSYTILGIVVAAIASSINIAAWTIFLRYLAGVMLIAMGLSIADWWRGIGLLERLGALVWRPVQQFSKRLFPIRHWRGAYALGLCWGLMPCGLIYSALAWTASSPTPIEGGLRMLFFGIGTLPAMLAVSLGAASLQTLLRRRGLKLTIAVSLIAAGAWTLYVTHSHSPHLLQHESPAQGTGDPAAPISHSPHSHH